MYATWTINKNRSKSSFGLVFLQKYNKWRCATVIRCINLSYRNNFGMCADNFHVLFSFCHLFCTIFSSYIWRLCCFFVSFHVILFSCGLIIFWCGQMFYINTSCTLHYLHRTGRCYFRDWSYCIDFKKSTWVNMTFYLQMYTINEFHTENSFSWTQIKKKRV